jgi:hypothetical protein
LVRKDLGFKGSVIAGFQEIFMTSGRGAARTTLPPINAIGSAGETWDSLRKLPESVNIREQSSSSDSLSMYPRGEQYQT